MPGGQALNGRPKRRTAALARRTTATAGVAPRPHRSRAYRAPAIGRRSAVRMTIDEPRPIPTIRQTSRMRRPCSSSARVAWPTRSAAGWRDQSQAAIHSDKGVTHPVEHFRFGDVFLRRSAFPLWRSAVGSAGAGSATPRAGRPRREPGRCAEAPGRGRFLRRRRADRRRQDGGLSPHHLGLGRPSASARRSHSDHHVHDYRSARRARVGSSAAGAGRSSAPLQRRVARAAGSRRGRNWMDACAAGRDHVASPRISAPFISFRRRRR